MIEEIVVALSGIPKEIITCFIAMLPISELRGAIPWALASPPVGGGLTWQEAYVFAVIGNFIPVIPILLLLGPLSNWLSSRSKMFERFFTWLFNRTRSRSSLIEKYEALGLTAFVAIPLPVTGAWTGCVAAFIFGIHFKYAIPSIIAGIIIAGIIVTLASLGVIEGISRFI